MSPTALLTGVLATAVLAAALPSTAGIAPAIAMTVEQAYQEMAHRHAGLNPASSGFSREEAACLSRLFELVDLAIVEKAQAWTWFQSEGRRGNSLPEYRIRVDALIARLDALPAPERLRPVQKLLVDAIRDQRDFFETWTQALEAGSHGQDHRDVQRSRGTHLRNSSRKLHQVYGQLMDLFPNAGQQNFDAFYDHLCVLDLL
jgi:hypothetical protein